MAASQVGGLMEGDPGPILAGLGSSFLFLQRWGLWFYHLNRLDLWRWFIQYNTVLFHSELSSGTSLWNIYIYMYIQILITVFIHISPGFSNIPIWSLSYSNIFIPISHHFPSTAGHPICARIGSPTGDGWAFWQSEAGCDEQGQQETWKTQEVSVNSKR